jgi:hypothetical protein
MMNESQEVERFELCNLKTLIFVFGRNATPHESLRSGTPPVHGTHNVVRHMPYADSSPIVLDQVCIFSSGPYDVPNVDIEGWAVYTNNANGAAMRVPLVYSMLV